jgi:hypothetical protein
MSSNVRLDLQAGFDPSSRRRFSIRASPANQPVSKRRKPQKERVMEDPRCNVREREIDDYIDVRGVWLAYICGMFTVDLVGAKRSITVSEAETIVRRSM